MGQIQIDRTEIIGTTTVVYDVWESYDGHSTIRHNDVGERMGRIGCRQLPAELDALEHCTEERWERVRTWQHEQYAEAYAAIRAEYNLPADAIEQMGEIVIRN